MFYAGGSHTGIQSTMVAALIIESLGSIFCGGNT
jgi:hypothetical protein